MGETTQMPRPLRRLPDLADAADVRSLRAEAKKNLGMSDRAAGAMSTIWVHPDEIEPQIKYPRRMRITGGNMLYVQGLAWTARLVPDPGNPRNASEYPYELARPEGTKGALGFERASAPERATAAELKITSASRADLAKQLDEAMERTRENNTPYPPIADQGIMDAPFGVMTNIHFNDGSTPIAVPMVREGSTRVSHGLALLGLHADDVLFTMPGSAKPVREHVEAINAIVGTPADDVTDREKAMARVATVEFILIVGFEADNGTEPDLAAAVKAKVAQEHINTKTDWKAAARNATMADDCLASLLNCAVIGADEYRWLMGSMTRKEAIDAAVASHDDDRFADLLWVFTTEDKRAHDAVRRPIAFVLMKEKGRSGIQVRRTSKVPLAVELAVRGLRHNTTDVVVDRVSKVLVSGADITTTCAWKVTDRSVAQLVKAAIAETGKAPGPAGVELAVRALYYGAVYDAFRVPRHDTGPDADRRPVSDLLIDMLGTERGVRQLGRIVQDGRKGKAPVIVETDGTPVLGADDQPALLRHEIVRYKLFPRNGSKSPSGSKKDPFGDAVTAVVNSARDLRNAFKHLAEVEDGMIETEGLHPMQATQLISLLENCRTRAAEWMVIGAQRLAQGGVVDMTADAGFDLDEEDDIAGDGEDDVTPDAADIDNEVDDAGADVA